MSTDCTLKFHLEFDIADTACLFHIRIRHSLPFTMDMDGSVALAIAKGACASDDMSEACSGRVFCYRHKGYAVPIAALGHP